MKKAKFIFKVNRNNTAKVYANKKWQKRVTHLNVSAYPADINVEFEQYLLKNGVPYVVNDNLAKKTTTIHFGRQRN